ncbi:microtubule-associated tumor suppressor candidate 2 homolog [Thalassophryne amazonica]|uniref:microtubule-associated tumor suppressor candidate 2 homolog n=1 Tax=Thalassophryne amazonica TaxID=390379 RepID=UPI001471F7F8|nr:microtubule-associated tumor suppressor candidate 2 homolog [Thalassophryne amazonica]
MYSGAELSSETETMFVSCMSTISSLGESFLTPVDTVGTTHTTDSWHIVCGPYSTVSEDLTLTSQTCNTISESAKASVSAGKSTIHQKVVDVNLNSTVHTDYVISEVSNGVVPSKEHRDGITEEHMENSTHRGITTSRDKDCDSNRHKAQECNIKMDKSTQADEAPVVKYSSKNTGTNGTQSSINSRAIKKQRSFDNTLKNQNSFDKNKQPSFEGTFKKQLSFDSTLKKQGSFENSASSNCSTLERRKPWGSPNRSASPISTKTTTCSPRKRPPGSPAKIQGIRALSMERCGSPQVAVSQQVKAHSKTGLSSGIPKPVMPQQPENKRMSPPQKPKNVRPKIITCVRKNPPSKHLVSDAPHDGSTPLRLNACPHPAVYKDSKVGPQAKSTPVLSSSNVLFDKYRQEMQKAGFYPPGTATTVMKPPSGTFPLKPVKKSDSFHEEMADKYVHEQQASQEGGSVYHSPRGLRPQLGLGAVTRQPAAKMRVQQAGQRSATALSQSAQAGGAPAQGYQDITGEQRRSGPESSSKSLLLKPGQSGLRPPGFSAAPPARLASFGLVQNTGDPCRPSQRDSVLRSPERPKGHPRYLAVAVCGDGPGMPGWLSSRTQGCCHTLTLFISSTAVGREMRKDTEATLLPKGSPKRFAVVSPKPQSSGTGRTAADRGSVRAERALEVDQALIQQLRDRCEKQALQLQSLQAQLKKASLCMDVFTITTQHFCHTKRHHKERELSLELARIRDEVAFSVAHWEQLQQEKEELEHRFETELHELRAQQKSELGALEERLRAQHMEEARRLQDQQQAELEELQVQQQEQIEEMNENHEVSLMEMETAHNDTLATLQEEHTRTVKNLKMAHEQQRKSLEEEFEKIRLSLQDQVDTLTFQNRSLRDRAKRFEEALRRSTDEQIVDALAPYKHIEEDLKSLKEVLKMKNQQIHQQELKISELEKIAEKNVHLEERLQVLQQQNEDLKERIDKNLAVSRQLSEENANLQVHVEKESNEKKRLSRTNEELLWRLQTGELSPHMSPSSSPIRRPSSGQSSPARPHSYHQ